MAEKKDIKKQKEQTQKVENNKEVKNNKSTDERQKNTENVKEQENNCNDLEKQLAELNDKYIRLAAEYDNYRKRTMKEKMELVKSGGADVLSALLPVIDNFERGLKALEESDDIKAVKEGIELIYKDFTEFLKQRGVQEIEAVGQQLDTDLHEAVAQIPAENEEQKGKIIDVIQKGYKLNDKILRFAKVVVAQ